MTPGPGARVGLAGKSGKGRGMIGTPDEYTDAAKFHAQDLQRAMQRDQVAKTRMLARVRRIVRRVLGRENPSASP